VAVDSARRLLAHERGVWRSLYRWISRRPVVPDGEPYPYAGAVTPVLWAFIGVAAIEVPAVHLLLPWETVRRAALVVGVYALVWMVGMLASLRVHPHVVDDAGLRIRNGHSLDLLVPWEQLTEARYRMRSLEGMRPMQVDENGPVRALSIGVGSQTNVEVTLREPVVLPVRQTAGRPVTELRLYADDARRLDARLREGLGRPRPADATENAR
jgi:hypothetical protein